MLAAAAFVLLVLAALLAAVLAWPEPARHGARAALLGGEAAAIVVQALIVGVPGLLRGALEGEPVPYTGLARIYFHLTQALFLGWPVAVAALAVHVLARRSAWPVFAAWVTVTSVVVLAYPTLRGPALELVYGCWYGAAVAAGIAALTVLAVRREYPRIEHVCAAILVVGDLVVLAAAFKLGAFETWRPAAQMAYFVAFGALVVVQGGYLCRRLRRSLSA